MKKLTIIVLVMLVSACATTDDKPVKKLSYEQAVAKYERAVKREKARQLRAYKRHVEYVKNY